RAAADSCRSLPAGDPGPQTHNSSTRKKRDSLSMKVPAKVAPTITVPGRLRPVDATLRESFARAGLDRASLESLLLRLRREADAALRPRLPTFMDKPWPLGRCREIRDDVFARLAALLKGGHDAYADP